MSQVHSADLKSFHRSSLKPSVFRPSAVAACFDTLFRRIQALITDGLTADAFLVMDGDRSIAVLLRRGDGYVVVARHDALGRIDGHVFPESSLALNAIRLLVPTPVTSSPVWYS